MDEKGKNWALEANKRFGIIAKYFKPKENVVIVDFITTAGEVKEEELKS